MKIAEIFFSLQGEGQWLGVPSVFIRSSGCNLRCQWCDTPYASWNPEGADMPVGRIMDAVGKYATEHVVITGGEPMVQEDVAELAAALQNQKKFVTLETAGTLWREIGVNLASLSPKLANSTPHQREGGKFGQAHEANRINMGVLLQFIQTPSIAARQWKFVVCGPEDLAEVEALLARLPNSVRQRDQVFLMPEGVDEQELNQKGRWLADICKARGYRFGPRLHIHLYGPQRGV